MALETLKFTASEFVDEDIASLPDQVLGRASWLKAKFDNIGKNKLALGKFNDLIDYLAAQVDMVGRITLYAGAAAPADWHLCDGALLSRTDYAALFAVIGTAYGAGDGSTTFALPNLLGRTAVGVNTADTDFALGRSGGSKTGYAKVYVNGGEQMRFLRKAVTPYTSNIALGGTGPNIGAKAESCNMGVEVVGTSSDNMMNPYLAMNYIIKVK